MPQRRLETLGILVREKRGARKMRETAKAIDISPATLLRVEGGKIPDVATFGKLCKWLGIEPGSFLGYPEEPAKSAGRKKIANSITHVSAHMRTDSIGHALTLQALAQMIVLARNSQFE